MIVRQTFVELRRELRRRGFFGKPTFTSVVQLGCSASLAIGGIILFFTLSNWIGRGSALLVSAAGSIGIGTNTHTSSHGATSERKWINELLTYLGFSVHAGLSATYWWHKHVLIHHSGPNVIGLDHDADLSPWFAMTEDEVARASGWRKFYYIHFQHLVFPVAVGLLLLSQQVAGCAYLFSVLQDPKRRQSPHWLDAGSLVLHGMLHLALPMVLFSARDVIVFYIARNILISYGMFAVLAPAHMHPEAARLSMDLADTEYALAQTSTTLNYRTGRLGRLLCSGLDYQIEHHLFPDISHVFYPEMSRVVEEYCRTESLAYRSYNWDSALWNSLMALKHPGVIRHSTALQGSPSMVKSQDS